MGGDTGAYWTGVLRTSTVVRPEQPDQRAQITVVGSSKSGVPRMAGNCVEYIRSWSCSRKGPQAGRSLGVPWGIQFRH
jgi:hypothetical protein